MGFIRSAYLLTLTSLLLLSSSAFAISEKLLKTLDWEFNANSANIPGERALQRQNIYHYEVPVELLGANFQYELNLPEAIRQALYFEKMVAGRKQTFVRWIINPEDTKHHMSVKELLEKHGFDSNPKQYFKGHLTASRSIFLEDPKSGVIFSGKVSTNHTGGKFRDDKKLSQEDMFASKHSNILANKVLAKHGKEFKTLQLIGEPTGLYISGGGGGLFSSGVHQGFLIRDLAPINNDNYYLPGFSALHENVGKEIARKNGSSDPVEFWTKHYAGPLGKALAELGAHMGFALTSAHNQQFLIELDKEMRPTGKIFLRDFNDSHIFSTFYKKSSNEEDKELKAFYRRKDQMLINFGLFHGINMPSWVNKEDVKTMALAFYRNFDQRYSELTGIPQEIFARKKPTVNKPPRYSIKVYSPGEAKTPLEQQAWALYLAAGECFRGADTLPDGRDCAKVLAELRSRPRSSMLGGSIDCGSDQGATTSVKSFFSKLLP